MVAGVESAEAFLTRREPTYPVGRWIDAHLPAEARLIGQDHRGFYLPRPYAMELAHRRRTGLGTRGESGDQVIAHSSSTGSPTCSSARPSRRTPSSSTRRSAGSWRAGSAGTRPIYRQRLTDGDGVVRRYEIYALRAEGGR